jgi:hypothetical protein
MNSHCVMDYIQDAFTVESVDGDDTAVFSTDRGQGFILVDYEWKLEHRLSFEH